jgi:hypothetical protein
VPLRIAFDMDGVLADMDTELGRQARMLFGDSVMQQVDPPAAADAATTTTATPLGDSAESLPDGEPHDPPPPVLRLNLTTRQQQRLWHHVESIDNFWQSLAELEPGVIQRLGAIAVERRWEVIFLTKRPPSAGSTTQLQTQRWLESKGFTLPSVYVVQGSRGRIAAALGLEIVVDDRPENCLDVVVDSKARAILIWRDAENQLPEAAKRLGIGVVHSVAECLDILTEVDTATARDQPGIMDRFLRLLGLKPAPGAENARGPV